MIFFPGILIYGIENSMGMNMLLIHMDTNYGLIAREVFLCKFFCNLQRQFWRDLTRAKGLDDMVALATTQLSNLPFGIHHLTVFSPWVTVHVCREDTFRSFIAI